jgi:lipoprotein-releasing system ATP-binding protein
MILKAEKIHKSFAKADKQKLEILKDISFNLEANKITVIVGASGAGKSTLLHILSGLDTLDSGTVKINDIDIFKLKDDELAKYRNKHIGFIFQFHHLLPEFTALENVAIPLMISGLSLKDASIKAKELLGTVGLDERINHKPAELSGGEQQRVAVARALANSPQIIFADEPTGNLDSANSEMLHRLFIELRDKLKQTFLVVTHNPDLVKLADIVWEMKDGKIFKSS